jgi:urease accessory protein
MLRVTAQLPANHGKGKPFDRLTLTHDQRRLRRKAITLPKGEEIMVDFPDAVTLDHFGGLLLEDGRVVEIVAAPEPLLEVTGRGTEHLAQLAWHIGNRHMSAQIEKKRILVPRDHVARTMLVGLGAEVRDVVEMFSPERGAYHEHGAH